MAELTTACLYVPLFADPDARPRRKGLHLVGHKPIKSSRPYTGRRDQKHFKAVTLLRLHEKPVLIPTVSSLDRTERAGMKPYLTASGKPASGLTADELIDIIGRYLQQCEDKPQYIVLDRDPSHTKDGVEGRLADMGLKVMYLPPRSPDLSPPDSHFFGVVKTKWRSLLMESGERDWDKIKELFVQCAQETDATGHIQDYLLRLKACERAGGQRFHKELQALKAGQKA